VNDDIPAWAIELIKQVERLNEKIPNHIEWVERNLFDHEKRLRMLERRMWVVAGGAAVVGAIVSGFWQAMNG
jgi:hypothetical protein